MTEWGERTGMKRTASEKSSWLRSVVSIVKITGLVYLFLVIYGYFFADGMIFLPRPPSYRDEASLSKIPTAGNSTITARHLPCAGADYTILYSHGNAEDLGDIREELDDYCRKGFSVIAYDYRGYGTSPGRPSEAASYADIDAVYDYLVGQARIRPEKIIVQGRSVGAGPSVDLAARRPVAGLILESGFVSAYRVLTEIPLFPFDKFDNIRKLEKVTCPVLVIHGKGDTIIPLWHGEELYRQAREPKMKLWVEGADHNDFRLVAGDEYWRILDRFRRMVQGVKG
jgi:abhydrolase domain-containing protein 17